MAISIPNIVGTARAVYRMQQLGRAGITVSVCFGPMLSSGLPRWSVLCETASEQFTHPYAADSFVHCLDIAHTEALARGWIE